MKAKPYRKSQASIGVGATYTPVLVEEVTHVMIRFPAPVGTMILGCTLHGNRDALTVERGEPVWTWNGDTEKPTLKPSILTEQPPAWRFHCWLNDGESQVLSDCYGEGICDQSGQKVAMEDVLE